MKRSSWCLLALVVATTASAEGPATIPVRYQSEGAPVDQATFRRAFQKAATFLERECGKRFALAPSSAVDEASPLARRASLSWGPLPEGKLGATDKHSLLGQEIDVRVTLSRKTPAVILHKVIAHELGHVLGLSHSKDTTSLMHESVAGTLLSPDERSQCKR